MRSRQYHCWAGIVLIAALMLTLGYVGVGLAVDVINDATRADLSKHVSNKSCGSSLTEDAEEACPGELRCFGGQAPRGTFDADRVGVNITGGRCVTPTYEERYCGIFAANIKAQTYPPKMGQCSPYSDWSSIGLTDYVETLLEEDLYDRVLNTDRNGTARIRSHGLELEEKSADTVDE